MDPLEYTYKHRVYGLCRKCGVGSCEHLNKPQEEKEKPMSGVRQVFRDMIQKCVEQCNKLMATRGDDYNAASVDIPDYFPFGIPSYSQMVIVKALRLQSETEVTAKTTDPTKLKRQYERLQENLEDLINYARFEWAYLEMIKNGQSPIEANNR